MSTYGYDSPRRRAVRRRRYWAAARRLARYGVVLTLVALAVIAVVSDHLDRGDEQRVNWIDEPVAHTTSTPSPRAAPTPGGGPRAG